MNKVQSTANDKFLRYSLTLGLSTMSGRGFYYPVDSVIGKDGNIYVLGRSNPQDPRGVRITSLSLDSEFYGNFGSFGSKDGQFVWPTSIDIDSTGRFYVTDEYLNRITIFDSAWNFVDKWGKPGGNQSEFNGPSGIAIDNNDFLYVVDHRNNRIQKFTTEGEFILSFGEAGNNNGQFDLPWGIAIGPNDTIYIADWNNDRIQNFSSDGQFISCLGKPGHEDGEFHKPSGVAVDQRGYMYVADWGNERIQIFDPDGNFVMKLRGEATLSKWAEEFFNINVEEAEARDKSNLELDIDLFVNTPHEESAHIEKLFWGPISVELDSSGRLYVTESNRHRIQVFEPN